MAEELTREHVARVAALAHLALTDEEMDAFTRQLADILAYAQQVRQVDTSGVPPTAHVLAGAPLDRDDVVRASLDRAEALAGAPDAAPGAGLFRVPRVIG